MKIVTKAPCKKYKSDFALLDIKNGRTFLSKALESPDKNGESVSGKIPVIIKGFIEYRWGNDDGTSIEFAVNVKHLKIDGGK